MARWTTLLCIALTISTTAVQAATFTVDSVADAPDLIPGDGFCMAAGAVCTLRAAIMETNALTGPDIITLPAGDFPLSIGGFGEDGCLTGDLDVTDDVSIAGAGTSISIIDGNGIDRVFDILGAVLVLSELSIINGNSGSDRGGCVRNSGDLTISDADISSCTANWGGGIYNQPDAITELTRVELHHNHASGPGGGLLNLMGSLILTDVTVRENISSEGGGISTGSIEPHGCWATNLTLTSNISTNHGGGIYAGGEIELTGVLMSDNEALGHGGGLFGLATITDFVATGNSAGGYGGGLSLVGGTGYLDVSNGLIENNEAGYQGGGLSSVQWGTATLTDVTVRGNTAPHGAGIHNGYGSSMELERVTISGNIATGYGAGMTNEGIEYEDATAHLVNVTISDNIVNAQNFFGGGGFYNAYGSSSLTNVTIVGNTAGTTYSAGAGLKNAFGNGTVVVTNSIIAHNHWYWGGGNEDDCAGVITSTGHNITSHACFNPPHGTDLIVPDAGVAPLADNGGPTETCALLTGSPAVDGADSANFPAVDQRGAARPFGAFADVGAFEFGSVPPLIFSDGFESGNTAAWNL
ncbi:MAG: choice-of-anchor Q domain-containing protein [Thermoanaerobaculales bacterium]|jgi:predicted outer membrane repeat protein|nr:choice-of-anchor Q domain-containing protein [Thermoanaerobaculales bacterium]